jgi:prepilin-type N-terminal cleavage/methylation domain-containing protein
MNQGHRRGFSLLEVLIAISMLAILSVMLTPALTVRARRERIAAGATYRWALTAEAINRINATPASALATGTTCDTAAALPIQFTRCVTTTNVSTRLQQVVVVVLPLNLSWIPGDTVTLQRANNIGPLDVGGGP